MKCVPLDELLPGQQQPRSLSQELPVPGCAPAETGLVPPEQSQGPVPCPGAGTAEALPNPAHPERLLSDKENSQECGVTITTRSITGRKFSELSFAFFLGDCSVREISGILRRKIYPVKQHIRQRPTFSFHKEIKRYDGKGSIPWTLPFLGCQVLAEIIIKAEHKQNSE